MKMKKEDAITIVDEDTENEDLKQIITKVTVSGCCSVEFNKNEIKSDKEIEVKIEGDHLMIEDADGGSEVVNFSSSPNSFQFGVFKNTNKKISNNNFIYGSKGVINGVEIKNNVKSNEKTKKKEGVKNYDMEKYNIKIKDIHTTGESNLHINVKIIDKEYLNVSTSGESAVRTKDLIVSSIKISTCGESKAYINGIFDTCVLSSSGESLIRGLTCTSHFEASASGESTIKANIHKNCFVKESSSGDSYIKANIIKH